MRYTKSALLLFGLGLLLGFVAVVGEFARIERVASALMALGLVAVPLGLFADGHGVTALRWIAARLSRRSRRKPRGKSSRKPAARRAPRPRAAARSPRRRG